ncbi:MAG TPA: (2Fe-2S)-binding protein [Halanaerobiales bacterium]|nr:(2Fe-2S)-binding protein [Halanaerobiales bacterium]
MERIKNHPILDFKRGKEVTFKYNGREIKAYEGETIAAALHAAGIKKLKKSAKLSRARGLFCAIGNCSSCLMEVDGVPNVKTCITKVEEGMVVKEQKGHGDL